VSPFYDGQVQNIKTLLLILTLIVYVLDDNGKPNGVQYEMKAFVKDNKEKKVHKM